MLIDSRTVNIILAPCKNLTKTSLLLTFDF